MTENISNPMNPQYESFAEPNSLKSVPYADSDEEYDEGCRKLDNLARLGVISEEEQSRRKNLIMEFMEMEVDVVDEKSNELNAISNFEKFITNFVDCLRDCFMGKYEVD